MLTFASKNKKWLVPILVMILLGIMAVTMFLTAKGDSGTTDEVAHIPAGYSYDKKQDYRLNPEHPPFGKALAGLPLLFLGLKGPFDDWSWEAANQWETGWNLLYEQGNNADQILIYSRIPMIFLTLVLGLIIFFWVRSLYGNKIALVILTLFSFSPNFIAHGHLVTTDISAAIGFTVGVWSFVNFLNKKNTGSLIIAGAMFGLAQVLKFSCFLLIPILFLILVAKVYLERKDEPWLRNFLVLVGKGALILVIGLVVIWIVYTPFVWNMNPEVEHKVIEENMNPWDARTQPFRDFIHHFEGNRLTRPIGHYMLGLFYIFGRTAGGNATYIIGHFSDKGISWYFPVAWLIKVPLAITFLMIYGIVLLITRGLRGKEDVWRLWYFFIPFAIYWAVTLQGSLNIGIRHLLPTMPFVYLFIARTIYPIFNNEVFEKPAFRSAVPKFAVLILIIWYVLSSIFSYPSYLAYFNELTWGKPKHDFLVDSNLDWGQDLKRLTKYVEEHPEINNLKIDYFGGGVPSYYIPKEKLIDWHSDQGPATGWFAISSTFFQFSKMFGVMEGKWDYSWLESFEPVENFGGSILLYNISIEDLEEFPPTHLAPEILVKPEEAEMERRGVPITVEDSAPGVNGQVQGISDHLEKTRN